MCYLTEVVTQWRLGTAHRNRYFPLSTGMNYKSIVGKQSVCVCVCVNKQIVKTIRNYYEDLFMKILGGKSKTKAEIELMWLIETINEETEKN